MKYSFVLFLFFTVNYGFSQEYTSLMVMNDHGGYAVAEPFQLSEWRRFLCHGETIDVDVSDTLRDGVLNYFQTADGDYVSHITLGDPSSIVDITFDCDFYQAQADSILRGNGLNRPHKVAAPKQINEEERRINECLAKEGPAKTDCICNLVDFYEQKYDATGKTIYLKYRQRAFKDCLEGE